MSRALGHTPSPTVFMGPATAQLGWLCARNQTSLVVLTAIFFLLLGAPSRSFAQALTILDCQGFTRASQTVEPGTVTNVTVQVEAPVGVPTEGTRVTLTNAVTGEKISGTVRSGAVVFEKIPAGTFTLEAAGESLSMAFIEFSPLGFSPIVTGFVGAAVIGGGTAGAIVIGSEISNQIGGSDSDSDIQPTPAPPTPTPAPPPPPQRPDDSCRTCDPDLEPEPLDDFFGDKQSAPQELHSPRQLAQTKLSPYS